jgi:hypothetical protein
MNNEEKIETWIQLSRSEMLAMNERMLALSDPIEKAWNANDWETAAELHAEKLKIARGIDIWARHLGSRKDREMTAQAVQCYSAIHAQIVAERDAQRARAAADQNASHAQIVASEMLDAKEQQLATEAERKRAELQAYKLDDDLEEFAPSDEELSKLIAPETKTELLPQSMA